MPKITLICDQCSGQCDIDKEKDVWFCNHCGTKSVIKGDTVTNVHNTTKIVHGKAEKDSDDFIADGEKWLKFGKREEAVKSFQRAIDYCPDNYVAWLKLAKTLDVDASYADINAFHFAYLSANDEEKLIVLNEWLSKAFRLNASGGFLVRFFSDPAEKFDEIFEYAALVADKDWRAKYFLSLYIYIYGNIKNATETKKLVAAFIEAYALMMKQKPKREEIFIADIQSRKSENQALRKQAFKGKLPVKEIRSLDYKISILTAVLAAIKKQQKLAAKQRKAQ